MSTRFETVKHHWDNGLWTELQVRNAVVRKWITAEEYTLITSAEY